MDQSATCLRSSRVPSILRRSPISKFAIIEAPSILGLKPTGVDTLPDALISAGLADRLRARCAGRVEPRTPYDGVRDSKTLILNPHGIAAYSLQLADAVSRVLDRGEFPVVLGGDCSILLGDMLALNRRGRYGLLFIDGHADFYQPEASPTGEAAEMDLAFATGRGPEILTNFEGRWPLVRDADVVIFGYRDAEEQGRYGSQPLPPELVAIDLAEVRRRGAEGAARDAVAHLTREGGPQGGFWIHLDADALDDAIMPAVDYRIPDGLSWDELGTVLRIAMRSGRAVGLEITIYNPKLDPEGASGRGLAATVGSSLG
ncbi:MAG: arginase family protein [Terriglobales bacterium]